MATLEELQRAAIEEAKMARRAREQAEAEKTRQLQLADPLPKEEEAGQFETKDSGAQALRFVQAGLEAAKKAKEHPANKAQDTVKKTLQTMDDLARVTAGPAGDALGAMMSERTMQEEAQQTEIARQRLAEQHGSAVPTIAGVTGQLGQAMVLPGTAFATPARAALTGGGLGVMNGIWDRMSKGEELFSRDAMDDLLGDGGLGAAGGFAGFHIGRHTGKWISKFLKDNPDTQLSKEAQRIANQQHKIFLSAKKEMQDSGVEITPNALNRLVFKIRTRFDKELPANPREWANGRRAFNNLNAEANRGRNITLEQLNNLRSNMQKSMRDGKGQLRPTVTMFDRDAVRIVNDEMKNFFRTLGGRPNAIAAGDAAKGAAAWERMNTHFQNEQRMDLLTDTIAAAEREFRTGGISFDQSLRKHFFSLIDSAGGRKEIAAERFTPKMIKAIEDIAYGGISAKTLKSLEKVAGGSFLAPAVRLLQKGQASTLETDAAKFQAIKAMEAVGQMQATPVMPNAMGAATGALGGAVGNNFQASGGFGNTPPRPLRPVGGMQSDPQFGTVPGLEGTKKPGGQGPL